MKQYNYYINNKLDPNKQDDGIYNYLFGKLLKIPEKSFKNSNILDAGCGYSPRQRLDVIVNILTNFAYNKRKINVFGGEQLRPNIHIKDMVKAYEVLIKAPKDKISGEIFNAGFENKTVLELAETVKKIIGKDVKLELTPPNDNRSYHISSEKIKKVLGFESIHTIADAVTDLKLAFEKGLLPNSLTDEKYFNIKRMQSLNLK